MLRKKGSPPLYTYKICIRHKKYNYTDFDLFENACEHHNSKSNTHNYRGGKGGPYPIPHPSFFPLSVITPSPDTPTTPPHTHTPHPLIPKPLLPHLPLPYPL